MTRSYLPIACSLPIRDAASQVGEWTDLHQQVISAEETTDGLVVTYPADLADAVEDLVARESACCAWLSLSTIRTDDGVQVTLASDDPDAGLVIRELAVGS